MTFEYVIDRKSIDSTEQIEFNVSYEFEGGNLKDPLLFMVEGHMELMLFFFLRNLAGLF